MKCFLNVSSQLFQILDQSAVVRTAVLTEAAAAAERIKARICALILGVDRSEADSGPDDILSNVFYFPSASRDLSGEVVLEPQVSWGQIHFGKIKTYLICLISAAHLNQQYCHQTHSEWIKTTNVSSQTDNVCLNTHKYWAAKSSWSTTRVFHNYHRRTESMVFYSKLGPSCPRRNESHLCTKQPESPVSCLLSPVSCLLSPVSCLPSPVSCFLSPVSCFLSPVSCLLSPVSYLLSPVSRLLSPVDFH